MNLQLAKDDAEHPIPEELRPVFRRIAQAFASSDYRLQLDTHDLVASVDTKAASQIAANVAAYGDALAPLNEATWERSIYRWMHGYWLMLVDLTTITEPVSDLTLHAQLDEVTGLVSIHSVHVP